MKINICLNKTFTFGNVSKETIMIPSNHIKVSQLKKILYDKYKIETSLQRLTTKIYNMIIILTNDFPLYFFYIKTNSTIHLEEITVITKSELISKKVQSNTKYKYLKSLGLFKHFQPPPMGTIVESQNEYIDLHSNIKTGGSLISNGNKEELTEIISNAIKNNRFSQFKELIDLYDNSYDINKKCEKSGWAPIHYCCYYGYTEMLVEIVSQYKANVNLITNNNWSPLHLAAFKGYSAIVSYLISFDEIDVNMVLPKIGTALHCACKRNYLQIVSILLHKAEPSIKQENGLMPIDLTTDKNIKRLINKVIKNKNINNNIYSNFNNIHKNHNDIIQIKNIKSLEQINKKNEKNNKFYISSIDDSDYKKFPFLKKLKYIPPKPPISFGFVEKMGKFFLNYNHRFIEINPIKGYLKRYENKENYPNNPLEVIYLGEINTCKKTTAWFTNDDYDYMEIVFSQRQIYRFKNKKICDIWVELINYSVVYFKFWKELINKNRNDGVEEYFFLGKCNNIEVDENNGNISLIDNKKINKKKEKENNNIFKINSNTNKILEKEDEKKNICNNNIIKNNDLLNTNEIKNNKIESLSSSTTSIDSTNNNNITTIKPKRKRRPNQYATQFEDSKLLEDSTLTEGITVDNFEILECLGTGTFGKVFKVKMINNNQIYAMKVINKKYLIQNQQLRYAVTECNVLKQAQSPFIVTLHFAFQTPDNLYMILDYCPGGDLNFHIMNNLFDEIEAKFYIAELILGIEHLHNLDIIYRDLKPENILISSDNHIKLADFGLAKEGIQDFAITKSFCGSPAYLTPEMINRRGVGKSADIYGIGAVLYEMCSGAPPFYSNDMNIMYNNITKNQLMLHDYFSEELKDLLLQLLNKDPKNRIGVTNKEDIKNHPFFKDINWEKLAKKEISLPIDLISMKNEYYNDEIDYEVKFSDKSIYQKNKKLNKVDNFTFVRPYSPSE